MALEEFDAYAQNYKEVLDRSILFTGEDSAYFADYKIRDFRLELTNHGKDASLPLKIMDFGCGVGTSIPHVRNYFANAELLGLDISLDSLSQARAQHGDMANFISPENGKWPLSASELDAVYAMCVFHHINELEHVKILQEIRSRLKPGGLMLIYEHNPHNPLTVRVVNNCIYDENAKLIPAATMAQRCRDAGFMNVKIKYRVFFPRFLRTLRFTETMLSWLPLGGQYYVRCNA